MNYLSTCDKIFLDIPMVVRLFSMKTECRAAFETFNALPSSSMSFLMCHQLTCRHIRTAGAIFQAIDRDILASHEDGLVFRAVILMFFALPLSFYNFCPYGSDLLAFLKMLLLHHPHIVV